METVLQHASAAHLSAEGAAPGGAAVVAAYPRRPAAPPRAEIGGSRYVVRFAQTAAELDSVLKLRFEVFNLELGEGLDSSYLTGRDLDEFDLGCHHLLLSDKRTGETVGTYRVRTSEMARATGGFYSEGEFNLAGVPAEVLADSVELGRACIDRRHRNFQAIVLLWRGLALYLRHNRKRYLFGCCSLATQDARDGARAYARLRREGHLHASLRVTPRAGLECFAAAPGGGGAETAGAGATGGDGPGPGDTGDAGDVELPGLFGAYLTFGAKVCGPPVIDRLFKTIDFFLLMDVEGLGRRPRRLFMVDA